LKHYADPAFWTLYQKLPAHIRLLADKNFALLKLDSTHPSVRLKKIGKVYSARVGLHYRALAHERLEGLVWFWIGHHSSYDQLLDS